MKMKHAAVAAAAAGMLAFGSVFGVSAAGIGYVNMNEVMQSHPKMEKDPAGYEGCCAESTG